MLYPGSLDNLIIIANPLIHQLCSGKILPASTGISNNSAEGQHMQLVYFFRLAVAARAEPCKMN